MFLFVLGIISYRAFANLIDSDPYNAGLRRSLRSSLRVDCRTNAETQEAREEGSEKGSEGEAESLTATGGVQAVEGVSEGGFTR